MNASSRVATQLSNHYLYSHSQGRKLYAKLYSPRSAASPGFKFTYFKFARAAARARLSGLAWRPSLALWTLHAALKPGRSEANSLRVQPTRCSTRCRSQASLALPGTLPVFTRLARVGPICGESGVAGP